MWALKLLFASLIFGMWCAHGSGYDGIATLLVGLAGYVAGSHDVIERLS